jgi:hypothetical protein
LNKCEENKKRLNRIKLSIKKHLSIMDVPKQQEDTSQC